MNVKDVAAGLIGFAAVASLGYISIIELSQGKPFSEPGSLTAIAIASVSYFYQRVVSDTSVATAHAVANGKLSN